MATHTISFSLGTESIDRAIRELKQYRDDLENAVNELIRTLTEEGVRIGAVNVQNLGALDTGELSDSFIGVYDEANHVGVVRTDCWYAVFVEYGTGVVGKDEPYTGPFMPGAVTAVNPYTGYSGTYSDYDQNKHGSDGWWYYSERDGRKHWTKGQPSRPFFYHTYMDLIKLAEQEFNSLQI